MLVGCEALFDREFRYEDRRRTHARYTREAYPRPARQQMRSLLECPLPRQAPPGQLAIRNRQRFSRPSGAA